MKLEITKMQLSDLEQIQENLERDFDDFWTVRILKEELENKNRFRFLLHNSKTRTRNCGICRNTKNCRRSQYYEYCGKKKQKKRRDRFKAVK